MFFKPITLFIAIAAIVVSILMLSNLVMSDSYVIQTGTTPTPQPIEDVNYGRLSSGIVADGYYTLPGHGFSTVGTYELVPNQLTYYPFYVSSPITIDRIVIAVTRSAANSAVRACLWTATPDLFPDTLVRDFGTQTTTSSGVKTFLGTEALSPGRYMIWLISGHDPTLRAFRSTGVQSGVEVNMGSSPYVVKLSTDNLATVFTNGCSFAWPPLIHTVGNTGFDILPLVLISVP